MYEQLEKSTIRMGDFCDYHFGDPDLVPVLEDVEGVWDATSRASLEYLEQRYDCQRRQFGRHVRYCVEKGEKLQGLSKNWSTLPTPTPEENLRACEKCYEVNNNEDFELSGCTAQQLCSGAKDAKTDCKRIFTDDDDGILVDRVGVSDGELVRGDGSDYRGQQTRTKGDVLCQAWASQEPNSHYITKDRYPDGGLDKNYCRNPDGNTSIWCFTMTPNAASGLRWDFCNGVDAYREWQGCMRKSTNPYFKN